MDTRATAVATASTGAAFARTSACLAGSVCVADFRCFAKQVIAQFAHEQAHEVADLAYFENLVEGVLTNRAELDTALTPYLDRGVEEVDAIERAVLRLAAYELLYRQDVPYRVVINEAIETAKRFGSEHGHTYVNGVLDRAAVEWRKVESGA